METIPQTPKPIPARSPRPEPRIPRRLRRELEREYQKRQEYIFELLRRKARAGDCNAFCMAVGKSATTGLPIVQGNIHIQGHRHIDANKNSLIIFPREHGKTTNFVVLRAAFEIGRAVMEDRTGIRINIVCATGDNAALRAKAVREVVESPEYQAVFPEVRIVSGPGATNWTIERKSKGIVDPTLTSSGVLTSVTSKRSDVIFFDDIVDLRNAITTPALRKAVKDAFYGTWMNLLSDVGRVIYVATPWHKDDLTMELMKNPVYALFKMGKRPPAITEVSSGKFIPVWPEQWPVSRLISQKELVGTRSFARGFLCIPISDEDLFIKPQWIKYWFDSAALPKRGDPRAFQVITVDPAISKRDSADYSVIMRVMVSPEGRCYVYEYERAHMSFPDLKAGIRRLGSSALAAGPRLRKIGIESTAFQAALAQDLKGDPEIGGLIDEIHRTADKHVRTNELALSCERGKVFLKGDRETGGVHREQEVLYDEMTGFPVAPNDDTVDALRDAVVEYAAYPDVPWSALKGMGANVQPDGR